MSLGSSALKAAAYKVKMAPAHMQFRMIATPFDHRFASRPRGAIAMLGRVADGRCPMTRRARGRGAA